MFNACLANHVKRSEPVYRTAKSINAIACALRSRESAADGQASLINDSNAWWRYVNKYQKAHGHEWEELSRVSCFTIALELSRSEFAFKRVTFHARAEIVGGLQKRISIIMRETSRGWRTRVLNEHSLCDRRNRSKDRVSSSCLQTRVSRVVGLD